MNIAALMRLLTALLLASLLGACAQTAPPYAASIESLTVTTKLGGPLAVGKFEYTKGQEDQLNSVGARAATFPSPVNRSYADYFADAATKELKAAGKFDAAAPIVLTGVLEKNYLSAASLSTNDSDLIVRFKLSNSGQTVYEKSVQAKREWESAFLGAVAIPRALDNYIATIQDLMRKLFGDPEFVAATQAAPAK